jgi:hypothetical protein
VAFSRDGATIFVAGEGFDAFTIDTSTGARKTAMRRGSWVEGAGFIDSNLLAVTGADGLVVYESSGRRVLEAREGSPATALAAEEGRVCAGARSGAVTCYSSEPLRPSSYTPTVAADRPESHTLRRARAAPEVPVEPVGTQRGTLESASGSELVVRSAAAGPPIGTTGRLAKRVKMPLGGDTMIWVEIARVKVTGTEGDRVWLEVLEERTVLSVNDQKHDYFTPGSQVRLEW